MQATSGTARGNGWDEIVVRVRREGLDEATIRGAICEGAFHVEIPILAELASRDMAISIRGGDREEEISRVMDVVAGDAILITGQSNAVAMLTYESANAEQNRFVRSFGSRTEVAADALADGAWHIGDGDAERGPGAIGQWALRMGGRLIAQTGVPLAILNGARGGLPIEWLVRDDAAPAHPETYYGRLLMRAQRAGLADSVRAIMYSQGESDTDAELHRTSFTSIHEDWREDFPNVEHFYVVQIRACSLDDQIALREVQRQFAATLPRTTVMSANGVDGQDGCHYHFEQGYAQIGNRFARLLLRDLYGTRVRDTEAIDVVSARLAGDTIVIETRSDASTIVVDAGAEADFRLAGTSRQVTAVSVHGTSLELALSPAMALPPKCRTSAISSAAAGSPTPIASDCSRSFCP